MPVHDWTRVFAGLFHDFHLEWISSIKRSLNSGILPSDYFAMAEQVAVGPIPDVLTLERRFHSETKAPSNGSSNDAASGAPIALATVPPHFHFANVIESNVYARKRRIVTIRHASDDQVVAVIEIVSPGNKSSRRALKEFVDKSVDYLDSGVHLLVLDLFPPGRRDPNGMNALIWSEVSDHEFVLPPGRPLTMASYAAGQEMHSFIEPVALGNDLPIMPLFLEPELYVSLPLEPTYRAAFEAVPQRWRTELDPSTK